MSTDRIYAAVNADTMKDHLTDDAVMNARLWRFFNAAAKALVDAGAIRPADEVLDRLHDTALYLTEGSTGMADAEGPQTLAYSAFEWGWAFGSGARAVQAEENR